MRRTMPAEKQKLDTLSVIAGLHKRCSFLGGRLLCRDGFTLSRPSSRRGLSIRWSSRLGLVSEGSPRVDCNKWMNYLLMTLCFVFFPAP